MALDKTYCVYVLIYNSNPIYIGFTSNIPNRIKAHRRDKKFNSYIIIEKTKDRKIALSIERGLIKFISLFNNVNIINAKYDSIEAYKHYI